MIFLIVILAFFQTFCSKFLEKSHPEAFLQIIDYCKKYNYPIESYDITTEDGYILTYFRIQKKGQKELKNGLPVVLLQHGILDSSDTWIVNSDPENNAPAFFFANKGFDVWLGNSRGNKHARKHVKLNPDKDLKFWEFSFQEMILDLEASFEYINNITKNQINYIAHSQGTLIMFAALSENNPKILKYLRKYIAMAPIVYVQHIESKLLYFLAKEKLGYILEKLKIKEIFNPSQLATKVLIEGCRYLNFLCKLGLYLFADINPNVENTNRMDVIMGHYPAGSSIQSIDHINQLVIAGRFQKFDYLSESINKKKYNSTKPPFYDIKKINFELNLFTGGNDELADPEDVSRLRKELDEADIKYFYYFYPEKGHGSYLWAKNMTFLNDVLERLEIN